LPWSSDTEIFFYRTDYFKEAGVEPPKTWDDLLKIGKALTKAPDRYAIALSSAANGILGNEIQHWCNQAGGSIRDLDNDGAKEALKFYKDMIVTHKIAQPSAPQDGYSETFQGFLDNRYAMWWCWDGFFGAMKGNKDFWKDQVSAFLPPKGPKNAETSIGSWGWAISAFSEQKELAAQWVAFVNRPDIMKLQHMRGSMPARMSLLSDPDVVRDVPSTPFILDLAKAGLLRARPVTPSIQEIYDAAEKPVHAYLTDQLDLDAAVAQAQKQINTILEKDMKK
jgi:ABC-type glycerol-3-phosphate transport system substrate-binding protein